jgi:hypothetical protein
MKLVFALLWTVAAAWAQADRSNGEPSPTVQQQQEQANHARKQHPQAGKPEHNRASLKTKDPQPKPPRPKSGEAALRTPPK